MRGRFALNRNLVQRLGFGLLTVMAMATVLPIVLVVGYILYMGLPAISWEFLTQFPTDGMRAGGIMPAIVGTVYLTILTTILCVPLGIAAAVYLAEYAPDSNFTRSIRLALINLAGIPSVVYGLFGLGLFVVFMKLGTSILAASLTLSIMTLPVVISTAEEALRSVPQAFRTVSISLGATNWQTIRRIVLPEALPGIMTGVILGLERAIGETAPILFTGRSSTHQTFPPRRSARPWRCPTIFTSSPRKCPRCLWRLSTAQRWCCWYWCWG
jgi:phosphate transport system permease protein